jgi:hypothetical protein
LYPTEDTPTPTLLPRVLMTPEEVFSVRMFQGQIATHFTTRPQFGAAGGPDTLCLTDSGWEIAYDMAAIFRFRLKKGHIDALETLNAAGDDGLPFPVVEKNDYQALRQLDDWIDPASYQRSLVASLSGDASAFNQIRDVSRILYVDHSPIPTYRITLLGAALVATAHAVAREMIAARTELVLAMH